MRVVRRADVDQVDVFTCDELAPVVFDRLIAPLVGESFRLIRAASADRLEHGPIFQIKEIVDFAIGVGMRPAHEAVTDHADVQGFRHGWILRRRIKIEDRHIRPWVDLTNLRVNDGIEREYERTGGFVRAEEAWVFLREKRKRTTAEPTNDRLGRDFEHSRSHCNQFHQLVVVIVP